MLLIDFREREKEWESDRLPLARTLTEDRTGYLGVCPDWESNPQPSGLQSNAQPTEPPWPGPHSLS